jgi:hypothetical protein
MSGRHVLVATMMSKSILRAVCAKLTEKRPFADYFPSYEIISAPPFRGRFFEDNLRSVTPEGVALVMQTFFEGLSDGSGTATSAETGPQHAAKDAQDQDVICEDLLLEGFAPKQPV